jgi:hypothetical protein
MNPFLQRLGYGPNDRVVIFHADDIGMCHATLPAIEQLFAAGLLSSCAVMVPCPWFPSVAAFAKQHPDADIGVHATTTCEWEVYRWGPLTTRDPATGLLDDEGCFPRTTLQAMQADPQAVAAEIRAQVERALAVGIPITHLDSHMGSVFSPLFLPGYVAAAEAAGVPAFMPRWREEHLLARSITVEAAEQMAAFQHQHEQRGQPVVDWIGFMPLDSHADRIEVAKAQIAALPPGLTHFILHPAVDTPELRAICADWRARVADYEAFTSRELRDFVRDQGIHVVGYRNLKA